MAKYFVLLYYYELVPKLMVLILPVDINTKPDAKTIMRIIVEAGADREVRPRTCTLRALSLSQALVQGSCFQWRRLGVRIGIANSFPLLKAG